MKPNEINQIIFLAMPGNCQLFHFNLLFITYFKAPVKKIVFVSILLPPVDKVVPVILQICIINNFFF